MREESRLNLREANKDPMISILGIHFEGQSFLAGCGLWDRTDRENGRRKDGVPGKIFRVDLGGKIIGATENLANMVYPLVKTPWGVFFAGCRNGHAYLMDPGLNTSWIGQFDGGIYGAIFLPEHNLVAFGGRNGTLFSIDEDGFVNHRHSLGKFRLWHIHKDSLNKVWISTYHGILFSGVNIATGRVEKKIALEGPLTHITSLANGTLAIGTFRKKILLISRGGEMIKEIGAGNLVCVVGRLDDERFYATDYDGRVLILTNGGVIIDQFEEDVRPDNPIFTVQVLGEGRLAAGWANGVIRILSTL